MTVYTIRLTTGFARGAALSDPSSGVNVCLVGRDGRAVLHRISPVNDPIESRAHTEEICELVDEDASVGADCSGVLPSPEPQSRGTPSARAASNAAAPSQQALPRPPSVSTVGRAPPPPPPKRRFQEGSVEEVVIYGPELGPLAAVLVGTESGSWYLDEMDVSSSRTNHIDRFVCRRLLGAKQGEGADCLRPVPADSVVYGQGEEAVMLTKDEASALYGLGLAEYGGFKARLLATTGALVAAGGSVALVAGGVSAAVPFLAGGATGLLYQWLLMQGVDHLVEASAAPPAAAPKPAAATSQPAVPPPPSFTRPSGGASRGMPPGMVPPQEAQAKQQPLVATAPAAAAAAAVHSLVHPSPSSLRKLLGSPGLRLGVVCSAAALAMVMLAQEGAGVPGGLALGQGAQPWQLAMGAMGFFSYKVALVGASLSSGGGAASGEARGTPARGEMGKFKRD